MSRISFAVIGACGIIGQAHVDAVLKNPSYARLAGVCDVDKERLESLAAKNGVQVYYELADVLADKEIDAVMLGTPHPLHKEQAVAAFRAGKHVLCEKPIAVTVEEGDEMVAVARKARRKFGVCYQWRLAPCVVAAKRLVEKGKIGRIYRVYGMMGGLKTATYYTSAAWRGTWRGEGGGFLINNAPHMLDALFYLTGPPKMVWGVTRTQLQAIETEDSVSGILEFPGGAQGTIAVNANQVPGGSQLEIYGDLGSIIINNESIKFFDHPQAVSNCAKRTDLDSLYASMSPRERIVRLPKTNPGHAGVVKNFCRAIRGEEPLLCSGREAMMSLEVINALTYSSYAGKPVTLPLDRKAYTRLLEKLKKAGRKGVYKPLKPSPVRV